MILNYNDIYYLLTKPPGPLMNPSNLRRKDVLLRSGALQETMNDLGRTNMGQRCLAAFVSDPNCDPGPL